MSPDRLHPDDLERLADLVAERLAARLDPNERSTTGKLVDATAIARRFGVDRSWVYEHADELGVVRLGRGPKARLRFEHDRVAAALTARESGKQSRAAESPAPAPTRHRRRPRPVVTGARLLPIPEIEP